MQRIVSDHMGGAKGNLFNERATLETVYAMIDQRMASRTWDAGRASASRIVPLPRRYFLPARFRLFPPSSAT
jgi:hypothetical protein